MTRTLGRVLATAILGSLAGATWLALFYGTAPALRVDFDATPSGLSGVYPAERDNESGLTFAWTAGEVELHFPGLDRHVEWVLAVRMRGARTGKNPSVEFLADDAGMLSHETGPDFEVVEVRLPARPERNGLRVQMRVSDTVVPGPHDLRHLGVMLDWLTLTPQGVVLAPRRAFAGTVMTSAAMGAALALPRVTAGSAVVGVVLLSAAVAGTIARGFGPYTDFPDIAVRLAVWIGLLTAVATLAVESGRRPPLRNTAKFAAAFSACALLLKLLVLLHPNMALGEALSHAHRFRDVVGANFDVTSIVLGSDRFPHAPGLYAVAWPFAGAVQPGAGDIVLLRIIVSVANALAGLLLYAAVVRSGRHRLAGAVAVGLYHLVPVGFLAISAGNLTSAFAQSLSVGALVLLAAAAVRFDRPRTTIVFGILVAFAFLSDASIFAILAVATLLIAALFRLRGDDSLRPSAAATTVTIVLAAVLAVVVYPSVTETPRVEAARSASDAAGAEAAGPGIRTRLLSVPRQLSIYMGLPALALAGWGGLLLWRGQARDALALSVGGWTLTCAIFVIASGFLTPDDIRSYLAALPAIAIAGGVAASTGWNAGGNLRVITLALLAWAAVTGVRTWWTTL